MKPLMEFDSFLGIRESSKTVDESTLDKNSTVDITETRGRGYIGKNNNNTINLLYNFAEAYMI